MSDLEPSEDRPRLTAGSRVRDFSTKSAPVPPLQAANAAPAGGVNSVAFDRLELRQILDLYGRKVAEGEWRDYAVEFAAQKAVFSIYRRSSECALYRIEKIPRLAKKQGLYSVIAATGLILKRGPDLSRVIGVLDRRLKLVSG